MVVVLAAVASSVAYSLNQERKYKASASLAFRDETQVLGRLGVGIAPTQTAQQRAAANAQTIIRPGVLRRVKASERSPLSVAELADRLSATVDPSSSLVTVHATAPTAEKAQSLANALAREGAAAVNRTTRRTFAVEARELGKARPPKSDVTARAVFDENVTRLRALSRIASPAEVVSLARRPGTPSSPRPIRNGVLGGLLGLVVGLLAVFVRDSFDRRLRSSADIEAAVAIPLLGHVGDEVLGRSARPGSDAHVSAPDWELFRILRRRLDFVGAGSPARVVAVTSSLPEEGKTTVASFLAFASAAAGDRTLLIECDLRRPVLAARLGLREAPGITDFVLGQAAPHEILQTVAFSDLSGVNGSRPDATDPEQPAYAHSLVCLTAGTSTRDPVEIFRSPRFGEMLRNVRSAYDLVILDTTPLLVVVDAMELLPEVDTVVMCVRASQITRDQARAGKEALERLPERPTGLVVTGVAHGAEPEYEQYGYY